MSYTLQVKGMLRKNAKSKNAATLSAAMAHAEYRSRSFVCHPGNESHTAAQTDRHKITLSMSDTPKSRHSGTGKGPQPRHPTSNAPMMTPPQRRNSEERKLRLIGYRHPRAMVIGRRTWAQTKRMPGSR